MDLLHLQSFVTLLREKSFSRAARALFLTQPAISQHIRALENELGEKLIDRSSKRAIPTEAGRLLERRIPLVFESLENIRNELSALRGLMQGALCIACSDTIATHLLPGIISPFWMKYPRLDITLHNASSERIVEAVLQRTADVGIVTMPVRNRFLKIFPLLSYNDVAVAAPGTLKARAAMSLQELSQQRLLLLESGTKHRTLLDTEFRKHGAKPVSVLSFGSVAVQKAFAATGIGVAIVPEFAVQEELKAKTLSAATITGLRKRELGAIIHAKREPSPAGKALLDVLLNTT